MKVQAIVEARIGKVDKVRCRARNSVQVQLCSEVAHRGLKGCGRIRHLFQALSRAPATNKNACRSEPSLALVRCVWPCHDMIPEPALRQVMVIQQRQCELDLSGAVAEYGSPSNTLESLAKTNRHALEPDRGGHLRHLLYWYSSSNRSGDSHPPHRLRAPASSGRAAGS